MTDVLRAYFARYAAAFEAYDGPAVVAHYAVPALFVRDGVPTTLHSSEELLDSVERLLDLHRAWGVETSRVAGLMEIEAAPAHRVVRVDWRLGRRASRLRWTYSTTYVLVPGPLGPAGDDADAGWLVAAALTHDAPF
jgi:hypothetical protein